MGNVIIQLQREKKDYEHTDLIKLINENLSPLIALQEFNVESYIGRGAMFPVWEVTIESNFMSASISSIYLSNTPDEVLQTKWDSKTSHLNQIIYDTQAVLSSLTEQNPPNPYALFAYAYTPTRVSLGRVIDGLVCEGLYTKAGMPGHAGSLRCMRDAQILDVKGWDYEPVDDVGAVAAIRKAGVDFKIRPSALDMWVPKWVGQAIKEYRKNSAYAGLKLHEFLKAVKGE